MPYVALTSRFVLRHAYARYQRTQMRIEALQLMMRKLGELEDEVLRKRRTDEARFKSRNEQKKRNAKEKKASQVHLQLIRKLTSSVAADAVQLGVGAMPQAPQPLGAGGATAAGGVGNGNDDRPSKRMRYHGDVAPTASVDDPETFRIRNRAPGGIRTIAQGASHEDAKRLVLMDKIREFADFGKQGKTLELKGLDNRDRAAAHEYCEELGLGHDSKGIAALLSVACQRVPTRPPALLLSFLFVALSLTNPINALTGTITLLPLLPHLTPPHPTAYSPPTHPASTAHCRSGPSSLHLRAPRGRRRGGRVCRADSRGGRREVCRRSEEAAARGQRQDRGRDGGRG
jgi:hypothetical protein